MSTPLTALLAEAAHVAGRYAGDTDGATFEIQPHLVDELGDVVVDLEVSGALLTGATAVFLVRPSSAQIRGEVAARSALTIGATTYATTTDARPDANTITLSIDPALAEDAAEGATATLSAGSIAVTNAVKNSAMNGRVPEQLQDAVSFLLMVAEDELPARPAKNWTVTAGPDAGAVIDAHQRDGHYWIFVGTKKGRREF